MMRSASLGWRLTMLVMCIVSCAISWWFYAHAQNDNLRGFWALGASISAYEGIKALLAWLISPPVPPVPPASPPEDDPR